MPLILGLGMSYSPLFFRARSEWERVALLLTGSVPQPTRAAEETPERLDALGVRLGVALDRLKEVVRKAQLDALIVLVADRRRYFNEANIPQLHVFVGNEIWGDPSLPELDEPSSRVTLTCDRELADVLVEEVVASGFELAESRGEFRPLGDPERGVSAALVEAVTRVGGGVLIVPIHINCHAQAAVSGQRVREFGAALALALRFTDKRVGILASGGLSGDPYGYLAGWVDDTLDNWVLRRLATARSVDVSRLWDVESQSLVGSAAEIRLWVAVGAAMETIGVRGKILDYFPMHHAAVGSGFAEWETSE